jgi:hypothetical protein
MVSTPAVLVEGVHVRFGGVHAGAPAVLKRLVGGKVITAAVPTDHLDRLDRRPDEARAVDATHSHIT